MKRIKGKALLVILLVLGCLAVWAGGCAETQTYRDSTFNYLIDPDAGEAAIVSMISSNSNVVFPASVEWNGTSYPITALGTGTQVMKGTISHLNMPDTVRSIGDNAFKNCTIVTDVHWSENLETIGAYAFKGTTTFTGAVVPDLPDSVTNVGDYAFDSSSILKNTTGMPSGLKNIGSYAFGGCRLSFALVLPDGLETIGSYAFNGNNLTSVTIPGSVETIGRSAFWWGGRDTLETLVIQPGVKIIEMDAFADNNLKQVSLPETIESIGAYAFANNPNLKSFKLPNGVKTLGECFLSGTEVWVLTIPTSVTNFTIGTWPSEGNPFSKYIYSTKTDSVIPIVVKYGAAYRFCVNNSIPYYLATYFQYSVLNETNKTCTVNGFTGSGETVAVPEKIDGYTVTKVSDSAFSGKTGIKKVILPDTITEIGTGAFQNCSNLTSVNMPASLETIGQRAFYSCTNLGQITLPEGLLTIGNEAFYSDQNMSCTLPASVISVGDRAFYRSGLTGTLTVKPGVVYGAEAFKHTSIHEVVIQEGIEAIGDSMFSECSGLSSISLPTTLTSIGRSAFSATGFSNFTIPNTVTELGESVFYDCRHLESVTIEEGVLSIPDSAFLYCPDLETVSIPSTLTSVGPAAFADCSSLMALDLPDQTVLGENSLPTHEGFCLRTGYGKPGYFYARNNNIDYILRPYSPVSILTDESVTIPYGKSRQLRVDLEPGIPLDHFEEDQLIFTSSNENVVTVDRVGKIKGIQPGTATITIRDRDDEFINSQVQVTVYDATGQGLRGFVYVSASSTQLSVRYGAQGGTQPYTISLSGPDVVVKENQSGNNGRVELTYSKSLSAEHEYHIPVTVTITDAAGNTDTVTGYFRRYKTTETIGCGTPIVALVNGVYQYVYPSYETVTEWHDSCSTMNSASRDISSLTLDESYTGAPGTTAKLNWSVSPSSYADQVIFVSSDPAVVSVEEDGTVTMNGIGRATITMHAVDGSGKSAVCQVYCLNKEIIYLELTDVGEVNEEDCTQTITAYISPQDADLQELNWTSGNPSAATVDANGVVTWLRPGSTTITARTTDGSNLSHSVSLSWAGILVQQINLFFDEDEPNHLKWSVVPANASNPNVQFQVVDGSIVSVDAAGYLTYKAEGKTKVRAKAMDGSLVLSNTLDVASHMGIVQDDRVEPTCTENGYSAGSHCTVCGEVLEEPQVIPMLGHDWDETDYTWSEGHETLTAARTCKRDAGHTETKTVAAQISDEVAPTCTTDGKIVYQAEGAFDDGTEFGDTATVIVPRLGHDWSVTEYRWAEDCSSLTASRTCGNDAEHHEEETVQVTLVLKKMPTETEAGSYEYQIAAFENPDFSYAKADETIPKLNGILRLPDSTDEIEEEALAGIASDAVIIPDGCRYIRANAFARCTNLRCVSIPSDVEEIDETAFTGCNIIIITPAGSPAAAWAKTNVIPCVVIP